MIKAKGNGQSECFQCKKENKYSLTWTSFLYKIENDDNLYCYEHALEMERKNVNSKK